MRVPRKSAEKKCLCPVSSEHGFHRIFRAVKDGILIVDVGTGSVIEGNPSLLKMLGCSRKALLKKKAWKVGFLSGPLSDKAAFEKLKKQCVACNERLQMRTGRNRRLDVELECSFYRSDGVDIVQFIVRDITGRMRLETELREHEELYRKIFDNSRLGIALISLDLRISRINQAFTRITGYDDADVRRLTLTDITHPSHVSADQKMMRLVRRCVKDDFHVEKRYIGKQGNVIWTNTHIGAVCDRDGKPLYLQAVIEDISERRQIEAELAEQNLRNIEKERTIQRLRDEFIFISAHELGTPVTAIRWSVELLKEAQKNRNMQTKEAAEAMEVVAENSNKLVHLVSELLEVARLEYGTFRVSPEKFSLAAVIGQAITTVRPIAETQSVSIKVLPIPDGFPAAFGDPIRVREVLVNLLTNAVKYNHAGGSVTVYVGESGGDLRISVKDTGFGLDAEDMPKLFRKFSRIETAETGKVDGTGLGLFIVKQIVERMGGRVWAESAGRGRGSVFAFCLPKTK